MQTKSLTWLIFVPMLLKSKYLNYKHDTQFCLLNFQTTFVVVMIARKQEMDEQMDMELRYAGQKKRGHYYA